MARNATRKVDYTDLHQVSAEIYELATTVGRHTGHSQMVRMMKKAKDGFFIQSGNRPSHLTKVARESDITIAIVAATHPTTGEEGFYVVRTA